MNQELREHLGKVAYAASYLSDDYLSWEQLDEDTREEYRKEAEASAQELAGMLTAPIQQMFHAFLSLMEQSLSSKIEMPQYITLEELRPGAIFVTENGTYAVKSEYCYSNENLQCQCILLASGEYAHFPAGNRTRVREVTFQVGT